ncbi:relaxase [Geosporobacter ferrireducens]|uniref:Relaxase n=1 Tax=Geosporobacter ferrireducens TaxID=1424294 RepID=A0A1D8GCX1_9FIRM|nr:relaxase/mobilization nuclease domain-containing protein [Geosporobacter ferrireducens]AOT68746.1 relaxase [Geosporobacter ferrireducens]
MTATTYFRPRHIDKGRSILATLKKSLDYGKNPKKTRDGLLISTYMCDPATADAEFLLAKRQYYYITGREQKRDKNILLYQIRQAFKPGEISPEEANRIGYELAMRFTKGRHAFIVTTHEDKHHIHSHIYFNSTTLDCTGKFDDFLHSGRAIRRLSDTICIENGLSIVENPKPSKGNYGTWLGDEKPPSFQEKLRRAIDAALEKKPSDFEAFLSLMEASGYAVKRGKHIKFTGPGQKRGTRCDTLKGDYTEQAIRERIEGIRMVVSGGGSAFEPATTKVNLLIDIQAKIQAGKGYGYERWAKIFNLKQAAQTLIFLQENGLTEYAALEKKAAETTAAFNALSEKIKQVETRMKEISELQKHISNYSRTREVYVQYRKAGYSKKFLAEHEGEIILHQSAKKAFDALGLKKLPSINTLKQEYAALLAEKKKLYQGYRQARENMKNLLTVKENTDRLLRYSPSAPEQENLR